MIIRSNLQFLPLLNMYIEYDTTVIVTRYHDLVVDHQAMTWMVNRPNPRRRRRPPPRSLL